MEVSDIENKKDVSQRCFFLLLWEHVTAPELTDGVSWLIPVECARAPFSLLILLSRFLLQGLELSALLNDVR